MTFNALNAHKSQLTRDTGLGHATYTVHPWVHRLPTASATSERVAESPAPGRRRFSEGAFALSLETVLNLIDRYRT